MVRVNNRNFDRCFNEVTYFFYYPYDISYFELCWSIASLYWGKLSVKKKNWLYKLLFKCFCSNCSKVLAC